MPFDILKIDKSFIDTIITTPDERNLVRTIITMAHQLGLSVIAEGVEQKAQMDFLARFWLESDSGNYLSNRCHCRPYDYRPSGG